MPHNVDAVPEDGELENWLIEKFNKAVDEVVDFVSEYHDVVDYGKDNGEPEIFAYARLLNRLQELDQPTLIRMLSAFIYATKKERAQDDVR